MSIFHIINLKKKIVDTGVLDFFNKQLQVILAMYFNLDKNNERPDWMTDLKHTDSAWFSKVTQVNSL
jgi:hypothetical protein